MHVLALGGLIAGLKKTRHDAPLLCLWLCLSLSLSLALAASPGWAALAFHCGLRRAEICPPLGAWRKENP